MIEKQQRHRYLSKKKTTTKTPTAIFNNICLLVTKVTRKRNFYHIYIRTCFHPQTIINIF